MSFGLWLVLGLVLVAVPVWAESPQPYFTNTIWLTVAGYTEFPGHDPSQITGQQCYATGISTSVGWFNPGLGMLNDLPIVLGLI